MKGMWITDVTKVATIIAELTPEEFMELDWFGTKYTLTIEEFEEMLDNMSKEK